MTDAEGPENGERDRGIGRETIFAVYALSLAIVFAVISQTPAVPKHHVVFRMTEPEGPAWDSIATHLNNMRETFAQDAGSQVEVR